MAHPSTTFRFLAEPTDVNFGGKVHGGVVMKWIDQAGYACAAGWSGHYCVTVSVAGVKFRRPILVGQIVEVEAKIAHTGKTSMQIFIQVRCGDPKTQNMVETNHCVISFVAMDETGYPVAVPEFKAVTNEDIKLENYAIKMKEIATATTIKYHLDSKYFL
jgi:acyl-CoA hydrolase